MKYAAIKKTICLYLFLNTYLYFFQTYIIVHEIGHAIGFYHEQSRNDRDDHIHIIWKNVASGKTSQFDKGIESPRGVEYDYTSVMHYGAMVCLEFERKIKGSLAVFSIALGRCL